MLGTRNVFHITWGMTMLDTSVRNSFWSYPEFWRALDRLAGRLDDA